MRRNDSEGIGVAVIALLGGQGSPAAERLASRHKSRSRVPPRTPSPHDEEHAFHPALIGRRFFAVAVLCCLALVPAGDALANEPNDTPGTATAVSESGRHATTLESAGDRDWFVFSAQGAYTVSVAPGSDACDVLVEERLGPDGPVTQESRRATAATPAAWSTGPSSHPTRIYVGVSAAPDTADACTGVTVSLDLGPDGAIIAPVPITDPLPCEQRTEALRHAKQRHSRAKQRLRAAETRRQRANRKKQVRKAATRVRAARSARREACDSARR